MTDAPFRLPMHVEERGERGRPLVLVHGFGAHSYTWRYWVPRLVESHRIVLVDLKGHGAAPKPDDEAYGPVDHADLIVCLVRARNLRRATLIGHSLGGGVCLLAALRLLERDPDRLDSLVIVSGAAYEQEIPAYIGLARKRIVGPALLRIVPARLLVRSILRQIVHDPDTVQPGQVEAYAEPLATPEGRRAMLRTARKIVPAEAARVVARYPDLDVPTLLLWGRQDRVVPPWVGERLARELPRAELALLDECGHLPQEEAPRRSLDPVLRFLGSREEEGA